MAIKKWFFNIFLINCLLSFSAYAHNIQNDFGYRVGYRLGSYMAILIIQQEELTRQYPITTTLGALLGATYQTIRIMKSEASKNNHLHPVPRMHELPPLISPHYFPYNCIRILIKSPLLGALVGAIIFPRVRHGISLIFNNL